MEKVAAGEVADGRLKPLRGGYGGQYPNYARIPGTVAKIRESSPSCGAPAVGVLDDMVRASISCCQFLANRPAPYPSAVYGPVRGVYERATGNDSGVRLDAVIRYVAGAAKYLQRREPRYVNPLSTPGRVSVGAHHVLISTARALLPSREDAPLEQRRAETVELVCRLPAESLYAAEMAIRYLNKAYGKHLNEPSLIAATYNAGSPRPDSGNAWNLKQYGDHVDRWVAYYNTSRMV